MTPKDLGRLAPIDAANLEPRKVLWERFCVLDAPRETAGQLIVAVTDLERVFGDALERRLELHQLPAPSNEERPRWLRGLGISNRVQARVYAYADTGDGNVVLVCEPALGKPIATATNERLTLDGRALSVFTYELVGLLCALHAVGAHGVRFALDRIRVDDGHYAVDGFTHLAHQNGDGDGDGDGTSDLAAFIELIRLVGGAAADSLIDPPPTSPTELWGRLRARDGAGELDVLPPEPPFVGRESALAQLDQGFDQAQIAKPMTVVVRGPRGVGKSRLMREFAARRLQANDALVLTGAWERQSADTRGGLLGALDQLTRVLARLDPDERDDIRVRINYAARGVGAIVTRSAPSLGAVLRRVEELPPLELGEDFTRHTAVIAELFRTLGTRKRPLVLILDNLESADASSIAVLKILSEASPAHHSLVVMGFRTDTATEVPAGLDAVVVKLSPLGVDEVTELLVQTLPGDIADVNAVAESLWTGTNGFPLAVWASLRAWLDRGYLSRGVDDGVWRARNTGAADEKELGVRALFGVRLAAASSEIREFALHAAVLGTELTDDEVQDLCGRLEINVDEVTTSLVGLGLVIRTPGGIRFPHGSILELVVDTAEQSERRAAHKLIAQMAIERQAPVAQIAYHRDLAFDPDNEDPALSDRLSRLHVEAGRERLGVYDLERARWHLERALEHSRDSEQRGIAAEGLADICLLLKDLDTAVALYTAIIATTDGIRSLQITAKVTQFLLFQSAFTEGRQLGAMAFDQVNEPRPTTPLGKLALFIGSAIRSWFGPPKFDPELREALVRVHLWLAQMCFIDDPLAVLAHVARGRWLAQGLDTAPAALITSLEGFMWGAAMGRHDYGSQLLAKAVEITTAAETKDIWAEGYARHNWTLLLFSANRYEEAQDMGDDAIGALREAGDVTASAITIMFKGLYGRDREPADRILRWLDEGISTVRRNGKTLFLAPIECLKLLIFARQGRAELKPRLLAAIDLVAQADTAVERLIARTYLAFAAFECGEWEIGADQVRKALVEFSEGPGVPDFCQDFFLAAPLILMELPNPSRADRKLFRSTLRKFRGFAKRSPRLRCYNDLLDLKLALKGRDNKKIRAAASKIVAEVEVHENLYLAHHAHRALSNLLKGEDVLAAAEHERMAHKFGRRLGLGDSMLSSLIEAQDEILELGAEGESRLEDSKIFAAAGMLTMGDKTGRTPAKQGRSHNTDEQSDVLEAWALTGHNHLVQTVLGDVLGPVRGAVSSSISDKNLEFLCPTPATVVPVESSALQVLVINMLLACQDTVGSDAKFSVRIEDEHIDAAKSPARVKKLEPGHYLTIRVSAHGAVVKSYLIGGFPVCEGLVKNLGGQLSAATDKMSATLVAFIPLTDDTDKADPNRLPFSIIVHPDSSVRAALGAALDELGAQWRAFEPHEFEPANIEHARVILADSGSLDNLVILGPLLNARLVEVLAEGDEPMFYEQDQLRLPIVMSDLEHTLRH